MMRSLSHIGMQMLQVVLTLPGCLCHPVVPLLQGDLGLRTFMDEQCGLHYTLYRL